MAGHLAGDEAGAQGSAGAVFVADPCHDVLDFGGLGFGAVDAAVKAK